MEKLLTSANLCGIILLYKKTWKGCMKMNREQILNAAKKNKLKGNEYETTESVRSSLLGMIVAILVGSALFLIELFVGKRVNVSLISVVSALMGIQWLRDGVKLRRIYLIVAGIVFLVVALVTFLVVIVGVTSK